MHRTLLAGILGGSLLMAGCSATPGTPSAPLELYGTLEARVTLGDYRIQELPWDIATISCRVRQGGPEARQDLGQAGDNPLEIGTFSFKLSEGTASVRTEALNDAGEVIGRVDAIVGIRSSQVTLLRQVMELGGINDSYFRPLMPLPFRSLD